MCVSACTGCVVCDCGGAVECLLCVGGCECGMGRPRTGAAPEGEASALRDSPECPGSGAFSGRCGRRGAAPAVLPPSARPGRPLGAPGPRARGSGGRAGTPGARQPPRGPRTPPAGRRGAAARPAPEAGPAARWGPGGGRARRPPMAAALVGSAVWRVERAGAGGWRWERAVGVDCSAPEPRCLWLPCLGHSDRRAPGPRRARVSAAGFVGLVAGQGPGQASSGGGGWDWASNSLPSLSRDL